MHKVGTAGQRGNASDALVSAGDAAQSTELPPFADAAPSTETTYLLGTPTNARRLQGAIEQLNLGKGTEQILFAGKPHVA